MKAFTVRWHHGLCSFPSFVRYRAEASKTKLGQVRIVAMEKKCALVRYGNWSASAVRTSLLHRVTYDLS